MQAAPVLFVDIDGVVSLSGFDSRSLPPGAFQLVDGMLHALSAGAGSHLLTLSERFELVWASGWEEKANDPLPRLLALPRALPFLSFDRNRGRGHGHRKLAATGLTGDHVTRLPAWADGPASGPR